MRALKVGYLLWSLVIASIVGMCAASCGGRVVPGDATAQGGDGTVAITAGPGQRTFTFVNRCAETIWVGALGNGGFPAPNNGGWRLDAGASNKIVINNGWGGRFWGRRGCNFDAAGRGTCATGDCGNKLQCNGAGGIPPTSLAEFTLNGGDNNDFYDLSLVDGFDLPLQIVPSPANTSPSDKYRCGSPTCAVDIAARCPASLQKRDASGRVVACRSACDVFNTDQYCCRGAYGPGVCNPDTWGGNNSAALFKTACPDAYSYAYDDVKSTYICKDPSPDYTITFCPGGAAPPPPPSDGIDPGAWYGVMNQKSTKCVDDTEWRTGDGTPIQQYGCGNAQANQQWQFAPTGNGYYRIINRNSGTILAVSGDLNATGNAVKLELRGWNGAANQQWLPVALGGGYYKFVARHSGRCLDVPGASIDNGVFLQQWDCNGTQAQSFRLQR
jgi:hypothetical protein